ncbi:hypothetical protein ACFYNO_22495 [Kitasatospora sp. NPDC006697]|uniref:hypothetical protein n=1 Tax=Kitasatospora sp. NPDC006697 TaxID=3364020 RepID=UPI00369CCF01
MNQDAVLRARVKLLGTNRRVLRGRDGLWVYRTLTEVNPAVYGSKLAYLLVEAARSERLRELHTARRALLEEAVAVAEALDASNPFRARVLGRALQALREEADAS